MQEKTKSEQGNELLQGMPGVRLTSVQFVLSYLILGFDEKGALTTLVWPEVTDAAGRTYRFGKEGYRDTLCGLIEEVVSDVSISTEEVIKISFKNGSLLRIPLREHTLPGERAIFTAPKHQLFVW
jgi:hypothetical protein